MTGIEGFWKAVAKRTDLKKGRIACAVCVLLLLTGCAERSAQDTARENSGENVGAAAEQEEPSDIRTESDETQTAATISEDGAMTANNSALEDDQIRITVGDNSFIVNLEENESAAALRELLADGAKTIPASNYGGFEKVGRLGATLPSDDRQTTTSAGDVMLYSSNQIVIFYGSNSWAYTRLGKVDGLSAEELEEILSGSETEITLSVD
ncbi:MAG: cyclophilin-like fold protein [bacterium]|nr:cyclophilin-like fold protein [bacterium]